MITFEYYKLLNVKDMKMKKHAILSYEPTGGKNNVFFKNEFFYTNALVLYHN